NQIKTDIAARKAMPEYGESIEGNIERLRVIGATRSHFSTETVEMLVLELEEKSRALADTERERDDWVEHSRKMEHRAIEAEGKLANREAQPVGDGENCWSCGKFFTYAQHSECDGYCPYCDSPVDLDDNDEDTAPPAPAPAIPDIGSSVVNDAAWKLHDTLTKYGPLNGHQFNHLKSCLYEALKIVMTAPPAQAAPEKN
ncbi:TPA: hypothetical protein U2J57_004641, partial [Serratia marcescens]|nr:hypothetical protein [Serratia marcescens]HEM7588146.1 hypothetical protein [Serratia marcescens]